MSTMTFCKSFYNKWKNTYVDIYLHIAISRRYLGNDTANCVKSMKLGIVVSFRNLIQSFEEATTLGHAIDDVSSLYKWNVLPAKQVILYTVVKQILCWLIFAEKPYPENQWFLSLSPSNFIWWCHHSVEELGKFQTYYLLYIIGNII